jgi:6-phosphogluconolactonase (cycloisomerase 2 family)
MPNSVYVCLQDEDKIVAFAMDGDTGQLTQQPRCRPRAGRR